MKLYTWEDLNKILEVIDGYTPLTAESKAPGLGRVTYDGELRL